MRKKITVIMSLFCLGVLFQGCKSGLYKASAPGPYGGRTTYFMDGYTADKIQVRTETSFNEKGEKVITFGLLNKSRKEIQFQYRVDWFTAEGKKVPTPASTWSPITLERHEIYDGLATQPAPEASLYRFTFKRWKS